MKDLTPNGIALRISFLVTVAVTIIVSVVDYLTGEFNWILLYTVFPMAFLASYIGFRIAVERFIYKKIKVIYKTIHNLKLSSGEKAKEFNLNTNVLTEVKEEVENWDKLNKEEIERLKGLENYRREFVGNVSHELKTPIFNIQGYLLTLLEGGLEDPKINVSYLQKANKSVERMIALIENLDEITKLESGMIEMDIEKIDLVELIKEVITLLELKAKKNNTTIIFVDQPNKPLWVKIDKGGITQVLVNLVVNSIKYGKEGGETLIKVFDMDDNLLVEVADNGQGIAEEHLPRLFERFYRIDKGRARESGGTGLGLSIVKHIIEAHNQTINVRSAIDVGSTFSFTLKKA
ncbi:MAG: sensor histidine kinase [Flavobacteriales bacterium]|nr:sensor histidine kinase [Flavobacteriales bacterium]